MKKKTAIICILALILSVFSGCCLKHEWAAATCEAPETCASCGKTQGEPLGHSWQAATCEAPETCDRCGKTQGAPLGHSWQAATCEAPETCAACGETRGEPVHDWNAATCEDPELCAVCGASRGEKLPHKVQGGRLSFTRDYCVTGVCGICGKTVTEHTEDWNEASKWAILGKWYVYTDDVRQEDMFIELREDGTAVYDLGEGPVTTSWITLHDSHVAEGGDASSMIGRPVMGTGATLICRYYIEVAGERYTLIYGCPLFEAPRVALTRDLSGEDAVLFYR